MRRNRFHAVSGVVFLLMILVARRSGAAERGLSLRDQNGGGTAVEAPVLGTTVEVRVTGIIARSRVTQIFANPSRLWMEGIYLFPLPDGAAVDTVHMTVGSRVIEGVVQEKKEARQTYETAKGQGIKATLIEEQKAGVFSTSIANIGPGETVEVAIELQQVVDYGQGRFSLRFPMVLAPRYDPARSVGTAVSAACSPQPPVRPANSSPINPFAFHVDLVPGFPLGGVKSPSHRVAVVKGKGKDGGERWAVDLADGVAPADSDFILDWTAAVGREPRAVFFSEEVDGEQYSLLMVLPPDEPSAAAAARLPRETVFVIDTSGSMEGTSIEQARQALLLGLGRLQPGDWFNVVQFNSSAEALFRASVPADAAHLEEARRYVRKLKADGGTEMLPALKLALADAPGPPGLVRQVIFVTDGQVYNEAELLSFLRQNAGERRLFTVAIGSAPSSAFLRKAAEIGRGTFTAVASVDRVALDMDALFQQLEAPLLRQIDVRWADPGAEVWPPAPPDLYRGEPLVLTARQRNAGPVAVSGQREGQAWADELPAAATVQGAGIDKLWARRKIESLLDGLAVPDGGGPTAAEVREQVAALGLRHHLVTPYTSLVAVDVEATAPAGVQPATRLVPRLVPINPPRAMPDAGADSAEMVEDTITVTGEAPILDERRISTGATVSQADLARVPAARDPWTVLQSTPSVLTDRINVGGNESGQQGSFAVAGAAPDQNSFIADGVALTDRPEWSSAYHDFDPFEEVEVDTTGADPERPASGALIRLTGKRGTNELRGTAGAAYGGAGAGHPESGLDALRTGSGEAGGPLRRDRLWLWGSFERTAADRTALAGQPQTTVRTTGALKVDAQLSTAAALVLQGRRGDLSGSGVGASPLRARETTWEEDGRESFGKAEATDILSANLYLTGLAARWDDRRADAPRQAGGAAFLDADGVAHGSWFGRQDRRRADSFSLTGKFFLDRGKTSHELGLSGESRRQRTALAVTTPDRLLRPAAPLLLGGHAADLAIAEDWQAGTAVAHTRADALWVQDILSRGPLTAFLGLRADRQDLGLTGSAHPWILEPRLGFNWQLGSQHEHLLRASLSRFASRLGDRAALVADPAALSALFSFVPAGGPPAAWYAEGFGPNRVDPRLRPEITDEAVLSLENAVRSDFVLGVQATWRQVRHLLEERRLVRDATGAVRPATAADWEEAGTVDGTLPDGTAYAVPYFDLRSGLTPTGGRLLVNGDRGQHALALSLTWEKRLASLWMTRGHLSWQDWRREIGPTFRRFDDPTPAPGGGDMDGGAVTPEADANGLPHDPARFLGGHWSFAASGLYSFSRLGIDVAATVNGRQGAPLPYFRTVARPRAGLTEVAVTGRPDAVRSRDTATLDLRIDKTFPSSSLTTVLGLEADNLFDTRAVTARTLDLSTGTGGRAEELADGRTLRLGLRLEWR